LISKESVYESKRRASGGYGIPKRNSDKRRIGWLENFAKRNVSCGLNSRYGVVMEPRHCERSEAIQFVPQKDSGLLRRFRSSQ
jgi:hypothetical protein